MAAREVALKRHRVLFSTPFVGLHCAAFAGPICSWLGFPLYVLVVLLDLFSLFLLLCSLSPPARLTFELDPGEGGGVDFAFPFLAVALAGWTLSMRKGLG